MRPVSIALGGVLALVLTGAAVAEPLNPQPLPPGRQAPGRQTEGAAYLLTCTGGQHAHMSQKAGAAPGHAAAAAHGSGGGAGKVQTACASGRH